MDTEKKDQVVEETTDIKKTEIEKKDQVEPESEADLNSQFEALKKEFASFKQQNVVEKLIGDDDHGAYSDLVKKSLLQSPNPKQEYTKLLNDIVKKTKPVSRPAPQTNSDKEWEDLINDTAQNYKIN